MTFGRPEQASLLVDARALEVTGIGRYLREVLARFLTEPPFHHIRLLGEPAQLRRFAAAHPSQAAVEVVPHPGGFYSLRSQASWLGLRLAGRATAAVAFFPHWDAPIVALPRPSVVMVHDLTHLRVPTAFSRWRRVVAGAVIRRVVSRAARVIANSEWTRRDLLTLAPGAAGKVELVPLGVTADFAPLAAGERPSPPVREPFLLCVGNRKPHKNLVAAVEVLAKLLPGQPGLQLVLAGPAYRGWDSVLTRAADLGVRDALVDVGATTDDELRKLFGCCAAFLFPSRYEGFGLPVLEAMACGAPVVASRAAALPEVVSDAGLLFEPDDYEGMADAVARLLRDPALRESLVRRGRERAAQFTWDEAAHRTAQVLQEVAARWRSQE
ncbi:MAG: glycosyltransferase family 4 protein [Gemmatimonadetes bacterium]|nr:glycosyltransferase family 4 protein [Gemmatimonadota bacterium]